MSRKSIPILLTIAGAASAAARPSAPEVIAPTRRDGLIDARMPDASFPVTRVAKRASPLDGNPNPWAALIDANDFHEGFEHEGYTAHVSLSSLADLRELRGQVAPNGNSWLGPAPAWYGILDNATAQTGVTADGMGGFNAPGSGYFGASGGPDPLGERGRFMSSPRGSVWDLTAGAFVTSFEWVARLGHTYYAPLPSEPVVTTIDWYLESLSAFTWFRPVSFEDGFVVLNLFMGGYDFATFAPFTNEFNQIDRPVMYVYKPGTGSEGEPSAPESFRLKTGEWFTIGLRQSTDSFSLWIRDSETVGAFGFSDASSNLYEGDISNVPADGHTPYAGEIFQFGWAQVYPGLLDDPATLLIEGAGPMRNVFGQVIDVFNDSTNAPAGALQFAVGIDALTVVADGDPSPLLVPNYRASDWYFDNYTVMGEPWCAGDLAESAPRTIDGADLAALLASWGESNADADLNDDSVVNGEDLALLLSRWGHVCTTANEWAEQ